jgi:putative ABC transport system substrate-binding protein
MADMAGAEPTNRLISAFLHGLRDRGWIDGANVIVERRSAEGRIERIPVLMSELVASKVDVIVTTFADEARLPDSVPIVAVFGSPVTNLSRPERNITGVGSEPDPAFNGKRLQLLKEVVPNASRFAFLLDSSNGTGGFRLETEAAARALGLTLTVVGVDAVEQLERALAAVVRERPDGLLVTDEWVNYSRPRVIADFAAKQRLPALYYRREFVDAGGLMSYGPNFSDQFRRAAAMVDKILKGARPADIPFELPSKLELVINLKAANALGLMIPQSLLLRADELIQ